MSLSDFQCFSSQKLTSPGGMNWRGTWGIPGVYQFGDVVEGPDGEGYVCIDLDGTIGQTPGTAPAAWQLLSSGTATAVSMTSANGSGITVAEPTPNDFTVATNLVAGSGISLTPSGVNTSLTIGNSGVLGVTSSSAAITVGGTAQNPILTQALPAVTKIKDTILDGGPAIFVTTAPGGPTTPVEAFSVVPGGVYTLTASCQMSASVDDPAPPAPLPPSIQLFLATTTAPGAPPTGSFQFNLLQGRALAASISDGASVTFTVPAGISFFGVFLQGIGLSVGTTASVIIPSLYLTRLA
jgi:hypothetical protein